MFETQEFVASCRAILSESSPRIAMKELMLRAVDRPAEVEAALGSPTIGGITTLHHSPELTVLKIIWTPGMYLYPHDHKMWAVIGIYGGREDNGFYRRSPQGLTAAGAKELRMKDAVVLGEEVIHAVANPGRAFTQAIHVYGGDFFAAPRSEWDPITFVERPWDVANVRRQFAEASITHRRHRGSAA